MKSFDERWNQLAAKARAVNPTIQSPSQADVAVPHGFATRVLALARAQAPDRSSVAEALWLARTRRAFFVVAAVGIALAAMEFGTPRSRRIAAPGIENTVAQLLWRL